MDHKPCSSIFTGTDRTAKPQPQEEAQLANRHPLHCFLDVLTQLVLACSRAAALGLATYTFALTAWRARRAPADLAFVAGAYAALAALLLCLRRIETLPPASADSSSSSSSSSSSTTRLRRRLHAAVWALTAALSIAFAYRVSLLLPPTLVALVWCMTSFVVILGFHMLVVGDRDAAVVTADGEPLLNKTRPTDEMV